MCVCVCVCVCVKNKCKNRVVATDTVLSMGQIELD